MSDSNTASLSFQKETTWAQVPAPCTLRRLRITKESLVHEKSTVRSNEIRPDRQSSESLEVGVSAKGAVDFELSVGDFDTFLESALQASFTDVAGVPTLLNGKTKSSFVLEKKLTDAAFVSFTGMVVDQLTLNLNSKQVITGQMTFLGKTGVSAGATIDSSGTPTDAGTGLIMTSSVNVGAVTEGGVALASAKSISLTIRNNARENDVIGQKTTEEIGIGSFMVSGKVQCYFRTRALFEKFINHSLTSLSFEMKREHAGAVAGDHIGYRITVPAMRFTKDTPQIPGKDTDVMLELDLEAEASVGGFAFGDLTLTGALADNNTVTIGGKVYTAKTVLTNTDGFFAIGASPQESITNLIAAINCSGGGGYAAATTVHPTVRGVVGATSMVARVIALNAGTAGNAITTTETGGNSSFGAATLGGGVDSYTLKIEKILKA